LREDKFFVVGMTHLSAVVKQEILSKAKMLAFEEFTIVLAK
jgi:hypothetical protein